MGNQLKIAVIGGGAAGFFAAINCKLNYPAFQVDLLEKTSKTLSKVKVSGGGRCNVTHNCTDVNQLLNFYPRGGKKLKKVFSQFQPKDTIEWFKERGVELKTEDDNRMFPSTNQSFTIINCFLDSAEKSGVNLKLNTLITDIQSNSNGFSITTTEDGKSQEFTYDKVIIATGGSPKLEGYNWLHKFNLNIEPPVPSLFTFNMPSEKTADLMGIVAENATVKVVGTKLQESGPVLFTHWGMSGPAILKTSAWGARILSDKGYNFTISINWTALANEELIRTELNQFKAENHKRKIANSKVFEGISNRLWEYFLNRSECNPDLIWAELPKKSLNKLINTLFNDQYQVSGKTTFKEEFVSCGGVSLSEIDMNTMQTHKVSGLYFAGEVLDIDGVTGGFNFQAAWSTAFVAAKLG